MTATTFSYKLFQSFEENNKKKTNYTRANKRPGDQEMCAEILHHSSSSYTLCFCWTLLLLILLLQRNERCRVARLLNLLDTCKKLNLSACHPILLSSYNGTSQVILLRISGVVLE